MKTYKKFALLAAMLTLTTGAWAQIQRVEPMNWWTGMNTSLQVMFYGEGIGDASVKVLEKGLKVTGIHMADSPNYLFVDVEIDPSAAPGNYTFEFTLGRKKFTHSYPIANRRPGSRDRGSFASKDMVYLIMPDRFANGDPSNDSTADTAEKANNAELGSRHGGDLKGLIDHLDYIADLGATAIWSTPWTLDNEVRGSYHGYACADYYKIDPRFGSNDLYKTMVTEAHERGIKTIMDIVTNHCGTAHWWMSDLPFEDWINQFPEYTGCNHAMSMPMDPNASQFDQELFHRGWFTQNMPDMNMENPFMLQYFKQWAVWWIENMDIDGFRVDTYPYNDKETMTEWVESVLAEYPNFSIVGESWLSHSSQIAYWIGGNGNRDGFDSKLPYGMDFPLMNAIHGAVRPVEESADGGNNRKNDGANTIYQALTQDFLYEDPTHDLMIFLGNHDTQHIADVADGDPAKVRAAITLMATLRGMPQVYVGTELLFRSADPRRGDPAQRINFPGGWPGDERNLFSEADRTPDEQAVFEHAKKLFNWRKSKDVIHNGKMLHFIPKEGVYVFFRYNDNEAVMTAVNLSQESATIDWNNFAEMVSAGATGHDVVSGKNVTAGSEFTLEANGSAVIEFMK
jgi:glycosidase